MLRFGVALSVMLALAACGGDEENDGGGGSRSRATEEPAQTTRVDERQGRTSSGTKAEQDARDDGGDDDGADGQESDEKGPSLAEYIERADPICRRAQVAIARHSAEYRALAKALARRKIPLEFYYRRGGTLTARSAEIARRAVDDLKQLPLPASRRDEIEAYLRGATEQALVLAEQGRALRAGHTKEVGKLDRRAATARLETRAAARRVGFRVCGGGGS